MLGILRRRRIWVVQVVRQSGSSFHGPFPSRAKAEDYANSLAPVAFPNVQGYVSEVLAP